MTRTYTIIVPRADRTGPTNVAVDIGLEAIKRGWFVRLLYLSGQPCRDDLEGFSELKKFQFADIFRINGVIHSHGLRPDLVAWLFTWSKRCVVLNTLHGHFPGHLVFDYHWVKAKIAWWIWTKAMKRFDHRVCISLTMSRFYKRQLPNIEFDVVYNFRSDNSILNLCAPDVTIKWAKLQRSHGRMILLYAGSLTKRKNVISLVGQVTSLENLSLLICGDGPEKAELVSHISRRDNGSRIHLAGHVVNLSAYLNLCDVLVLPSHAEGLPLVILEAARSGVPSLMSNLAVHRELSTIGFGLTFDRFSFKDFHEKVCMLALDRTRESDHKRSLLWRQRFSSSRGFDDYEKLIKRSEN